MAQFIYYHYTPNLVAAAIFIVLFSFITILHCIRLAHSRAWFMAPVVVGGIFEITAYIGRSVSHHNIQELGPYITDSVLALVAPALFAASIYMILGRIMRFLQAAHLSLVNVDKMTQLFVLGDILSFQVQSAGAGLQAAKTASSQHTGQILIIVGLFLQIATFAFFLVVAAVFQLRLRRQPTGMSQGAFPWKTHLGTLYLASALILIRNIVRIFAFIQGFAGYINSHEAFLYVFDALPMLSVMIVMAVVYAPGLFLKGGVTNAPGRPASLGLNRLPNA